LATAVGMLRLLVAVPEKIEAVAGRVRERAPGDREALLLATVPGLGYYAALLVLAGIGTSPASRWRGCYRAAPGLVPSTYVWWGSNARCHHQAGPSFRLLDAGGGGHASGESAWAPAGFYRQLLVGKGAQKVRVAVARSFTKAVFWMLRTGRSYREVEPYLASQGQASSGRYMADK
jgi:hypothetical protein